MFAYGYSMGRRFSRNRVPIILLTGPVRVAGLFYLFKTLLVSYKYHNRTLITINMTWKRQRNKNILIKISQEIIIVTEGS